MNSPSDIEIQRIHTETAAYFAQASELRDLTHAKLRQFLGCSTRTVARLFPPQIWQEMQRAWALPRLRRAMDAMFEGVTLQKDVNARAVARRAGVSDGYMDKLIGTEWRARLAQLLSNEDALLAAIRTLVDTCTTLEAYTLNAVYAQADVIDYNIPAVRRAYREGHATLSQRLAQQSPQPGVNMCRYGESWIDLDADIWNLHPSGGEILRRQRLRPDIAEIGWQLLREELRTKRFTINTISTHFRGLIYTNDLLSTGIPDLRSITLSSLQRAWSAYQGSPAQRMLIKPMLTRLLRSLAVQAQENDPTRYGELTSIAAWMEVMAQTANPLREDADFLSTNEYDAVLQACLKDLHAGLTFAHDHPDLLSLNINDMLKRGAHVLMHWSVALMLLVLFFTGMRRQSLCRLTIDDIAEVRANAFALAWSHGKKGEENIAIIPAFIARHLQRYIAATAEVRAQLGIKQIFLIKTQQGYWKGIAEAKVDYWFDDFTHCHTLRRDECFLRLSSTLMRRTFATRAAYEQQNLAALQAQLGHASLDTTLHYIKYDRYVLPDQLRAPLDDFARISLIRWKAPLVVEDLPDEERRRLFLARPAQEMEVGVCRHETCVHAERGAAPPCTLCEHLVTGPEFFPAWDREQVWREHEIRVLAAQPVTHHLAAQLRSQLARFLENYGSVRARSVP